MSMARLIRPLRNSFLSHSSSSSNSKILTLRLHQQPPPHTSPLNPNLSPQTPRTYISQNQKSAVDENLTRIIRNEIQYELERLPLNQPGTEYDSFVVDGRPGEKWVTMSRKFGNNEDIKIEATMFDGSIPASKSGETNARRRHISLVITINKQGSRNKLEILCSAWPDCIEIDKLGTRKLERTPSSNSYFGPDFKELDDELDDALYVFLEERGVDDDLAVFLHSYMKNKEKIEYVRWMETMKSFVEKK